jgi:hypothetical protein
MVIEVKVLLQLYLNFEFNGLKGHVEKFFSMSSIKQI